MTRTQYYCASSLDGFIAETDDGLEWLTTYEGTSRGEGEPSEGEPSEGAYERFYAGIGALIMGSTTYEFVLTEARAWPYERKPTWVLSSRDLPTPDEAGADIRIVDARVRDLYEDLVAAAGDRNIWIVGGGNVASQFADAELLDEVLVTLVPVVLGEGKPLFERRLPTGALRLVGTRTFDNGMVELRYLVNRQR